MAGKVQVAKFSGVGFKNHNDGHYINPSPPTASHWKMEEEESLIDQLYDQSFKKRAEVLEQLLITAKCSNGRLQYSNTYAVFHGLEQALTDVSWEVRLKCVQLITVLLPNLIEETDTCMTVVLHILIPQLGDGKPTVRKAVIQCLHVYMKNTSNMHLLLGAIIKYGLEHPDPQVCRETIVTLPVLLTHDFSNENFFEIIKSLSKKLLDSSMEQSQDSIINTLDKVHNLVGDAIFYSYLQKLSPPLRRYYLQLSKKQVLKVEESPHKPTELVLDSRTTSPGSYVYTNDEADSDNIYSYEFGIIPSHIMAQIYDQDNFRSRSQAVEELKNILKDLYKLDLLTPHMLSFISFISSLMDDANFKITMATLDIMGILVDKLGSEVKHFMKPLIASITKRMGDNKIVVRQAVMRVATQMMQCCSAKPVLSVICDNLQHRNSRIRQEAINIIIASLLKFPSYDFDLASLCRTVGPGLLDSKRHVRQAALECFAVLAQAMGLGRMQPLIHAVDEVELSIEGEGVMAAVQARLARRQLPKLNVDGLVEYATPLPNSGTRSAMGVPQGADIDWILAAASGGSGSARTARSDAMELESVSSRSTPAVPVDPATPVPRRFMSAGRGRSKLPWEEDRDERSGTAPIQVIRAGRADHSPAKPRMTWHGESPDTSRNEQTEYADTARSVNKGGSKRGPGPMKLVNIDSDDKPETYRESWTDRDSHRPTKSKLEPIPDDITPPETPHKRQAASVKDAFDDTPVHLAAAMARGSATPHNKVPPITPSTARDADSDRGYSPTEYHTPNDMMNSLSRIRNSASKKKAAKLFEKLERRQSRSGASPQSPSPPGSESLTESGIFSSPSTGREEASDKAKSNKVPGPFESRPCLARAGSLRDKKGSPGPPTNADSKIHKPDYNPNSGVTFHANRSSDVQIVGRGYNDDPSPTDTRTMPGNMNSKNRDRKRPAKGGAPTLSPLGVATPYSYGSLFDQDDDYEVLYLDSGYRSDKIGVVGRGVFESNIYGSDNAGNIGANMNERSDWRASNQAYKSMPAGIYGVGVRQNSTDKDSDQEEVEEDGSNLSVSKTTRERIAVKKQQRQEEVTLQKRSPNGLHQYDESEQQLQERNDNFQRERERQQEKLKQLSQPDRVASDGSTAPPATGGNASLVSSSPPLSAAKIITSTDASLLSGAVPTCFHNATKTKHCSTALESDNNSKQRQANNSLANSSTPYSSRFNNHDQTSLASNSEQPITTSTTTVSNNSSYSPKSCVTSTTNLTPITPCTSSSLPPSSDQSFTCSSNGGYEPSPMFSDEEGSPLSSYNTSPTKSPTKPITSITPRKKAKSALTNTTSGDHRESIPSSSSSKSLMTSDNPDDWEPFKDPDAALKEALKYMAMDDWEQKCNGLNMVRRLAAYHIEVLNAQLHPLTLALIAEVKNLRSQVSRIAISCFVDLFLNARKNMEVDLEMTTKVLLAKNGESNGFIREDVERALTAMVDSVTPQRALLVLIINGATHRNPVVRRTAAQFLVDVVEKMGPGRILSGVKDTTDRLLPTAAQFAVDGSPETRYHGRTILYMLMSHQDFDKMLSKHLPANTLRTIKDIVDTLRAKGLGDIPSESASARSRRSGQGSRSGSFRGGSAASSVSAMSDVTKRRVVHSGDQIQEDIKQLNNLLGASDWKDRYKGISQFLEMCESSADLVGTHIIKIFDKFLPRLQDANSKVNLYALQVMLQVVPLLHNWLSSVINLTVQKVAPNLNSKNKDIYTITMDILDSIMANIDGSLLIQPFADQSQSASPRSKPELIEKVAFLVTMVYPKKQKPVVLHVLPLLWDLLSSGNTSGIQTGHGPLRLAVVKLVRSLHDAMGHSLVEHANSSPTLTPRQLQLLKDLIDQ